MMRHVRFLLLGLLMLPFAASEVVGQSCDLPAYGPDPDSLPIAAALDSVQACVMPTRSAQRAVRRAGESGDRAYVPQLKQIAARFTTISRSISFNALHALYLLDEPESYFLQNAQQYASDEWLARYSVWVIARDPDSTTYFQVLKPIRDAAHDITVEGAIDEYGHMLETESDFDSAAETLSLEAKLKILMGFAEDGYRFGWIEPGGGYPEYEGDSKTYLRPEVVWARNRLRLMANQYPQQVQQFINDISLAELEEYTYFANSDAFQNYSASDRQRVLDRFKEYLMSAAFPEGPLSSSSNK